MYGLGQVAVTLRSRIDHRKVAPDVGQAMYGLEECVNKSGLERSLLNLVKLRASQINNCAWCIDTPFNGLVCAHQCTYSSDEI